MTANCDGNGNLQVVGTATGHLGTVAIDMTYTASIDGGDLKSFNGSNDFGTITHIDSGQTIQIRGRSNGEFAGALQSTGAFTASLSGWFENVANGNLVGDWYGNEAEAVCDPCH